MTCTERFTRRAKCTRVIYRTDFLNFVWLICLYCCILLYRLFTVCFVQTFFSQISKFCPLKCVFQFDLSKDFQYFFWKVFKFQAVTIFSLNEAIFISLLFVLLSYFVPSDFAWRACRSLVACLMESHTATLLMTSAGA